MSLLKVILYPVPAFDATKSQKFKFAVQGSNSQIKASKLTIRKQEDNSIIYDQQLLSLKYEYILPKDILTNGEYYNAIITVYQDVNVSAGISSPIEFKCISAPDIKFTNLPVGNLIDNPSFNFKFKYTQENNEPLNIYKLNLYDSKKFLISSSGELYAQSNSSPYMGEYLFSGFENNKRYYIELSIETLNGFKLNTELILLDIQYLYPQLSSIITLKNKCNEGYIEVASNIQLIDGEANPEPPKYIDNKEIDLTDYDSYVKWEKVYNIGDDFVARVWFRAANDYSTLLQFSNTLGQSIRVDYMQGYESKDSEYIGAYARLIVSSLNGMEYYIYSNYTKTLLDGEKCCLQIKRVDSIYEIQLILL